MTGFAIRLWDKRCGLGAVGQALWPGGCGTSVVAWGLWDKCCGLGAVGQALRPEGRKNKNE